MSAYLLCALSFLPRLVLPIEGPEEKEGVDEPSDLVDSIVGSHFRDQVTPPPRETSTFGFEALHT